MRPEDTPDLIGQSVLDAEWDTQPDFCVKPPKFDVITNMPPACPENVNIKSVSDMAMLAVGVFALLAGSAGIIYILWTISYFNWLTITS